MKAHSCPIQTIQPSLQRLSCILSSSQGQLPTTRKKAESDLDYNPENDEDTQDTEEDVQLEKTPVHEQAKKGYILFEYIILCIIVSTKSYVQIIYIIYCMSFLIFSPTTSFVQCFQEKNVTRSGESNYFTDC